MSETVEETQTAGRLLREARQSAGIHIAALAVALKVPVSKLEALEEDNYAALPDTVFVRALASSVCRTLKVDSTPILSLLPQTQSPRLASDNAGLNAPVRASSGKLSSSAASFSSNSASRSVSLVVLALLVGALVIFLVPRQQDLPVAGSEPAPSAAMPVRELVADERARSTPSGETLSVVSDEHTVHPATTPASPVAPAVSGPSAGAGTLSAQVGSGVGEAGLASTLTLRARNQSWIQVRDAAGAVVLQRNLGSGESATVDAPTPLSVVVGRADATDVFVRGKPFDLTGLSRENVARFEVK